MGHGTMSIGRLFNLLLFVVEGNQYIGQSESVPFAALYCYNFFLLIFILH